VYLWSQLFLFKENFPSPLALSATKLGLGTSSAIRLLADYASAVQVLTQAKQFACFSRTK
jgi:hypothetical protein